MILPDYFFTLKNKGFTLIELLIVIAILGIILSLGFAGFQRAQVNARDSRRIKDINQIKAALELHFDNNLFYPPTKNGAITCPAFPMGAHRSISWGGLAAFSCDGIVYMKAIPKDPTATTTHFYCYRAEVSPPNPSSAFFKLWAIMENPKNKNTDDSPVGVCAGGGYNYKLESEK